MRQIKFRGFRTDGKGWVYGYIDYNEYNNIAVIHSNADTTQVIPESVGQFTGLHDKNGVEIYEGDIIKRNHEYTVKFHKGGWWGVHKDGYFMSYDNMRFDFEVIGNTHAQDGGQKR